MENNNIYSGIGGVLIGATLMMGGIEVSQNDIDPITGEEYVEIVTNPEKDVYYIFDVANVTEEHWLKAHQKPETARHSLDGSKVLLKFDIYEVPRNEQYPTPMNNAEILEALQSPEWQEAEGEVVKEGDGKDLATDEIIVP